MSYAVRSVQPLVRSRALIGPSRRLILNAQEREGGEKRWAREWMRRGTEITAREESSDH